MTEEAAAGVQVPRRMIGTDAFQETPIVEVTRQITKHNYLVMDIRDLPRIIKEARPSPAPLQPCQVKAEAERSDGILLYKVVRHKDVAGCMCAALPSQHCCSDSVGPHELGLRYGSRMR